MTDGLPTSAEVVVIGAGAVGACIALELARAGRDVLVLDAGAVGGGASAGTACLVTASHAERMASPAALWEGVRALPDPAGPLSIRPAPRILGWLARYTVSSLRRGAAYDGTELLTRLALESLDVHRALHAEMDTGLVENGVLNAYLTEAGVAASAGHAAELRGRGVAAAVLDAAAVAELEPGLAGALGGILIRTDAHLDSQRFTQRVALAAATTGARIETGTEVHGVAATPAGIRLATSAGSVIAAQVVIAAGVVSPRLARDIGEHLPIVAAKGYHVEYAPASPLGRPVFLAETRVVATPLEGRVRLAGTLELGSDLESVDARRVEAIRAAGRRHVPALVGARETSVWRGLRPMTPDGMPVVDVAAGEPRVILATGHGMLGITLAPVTARLVARLAAGEPLPADMAQLRAGRFLTPRRVLTRSRAAGSPVR